MHQNTHPQNTLPTNGFLLAGELAIALNVSRTQVHRLRHDGEIPAPVRDKEGKMIGFPVGEIHAIAEARRQHLPKTTRLEIAQKLQARRQIDTASLADQFLATIH